MKYRLLLFTLLISPWLCAEDLDQWLRNQLNSPLARSDQIQHVCSTPESLNPKQRTRMEEEAQKAIPIPKHLNAPGDRVRGERLAYGTGDHDGNCVGCHRLQKSDVAYGTLGPSLLGYGSQTPKVDQRHVWAHLYNPKAFNLCSVMPRFGQQHILDEAALKDLTAFLLDDASPVNQP